MKKYGSNGFDESKAYQAQEEEGTAFVGQSDYLQLHLISDFCYQFDDGREVELLHFVYSHPSIENIRASPTDVLKAIDDYGRTQKYLMNVGDDKGKIVANLIAERKPQVMVELGGYIGYSCILFGDAVRKAGGKRYFSLERNPEFAAVIMSLVDLAGLSDVVKVVVGSSADSIKRLHTSGELRHIDLMFLDHYKPAYTTDLRLCEHLGLVSAGTVLAADNVIKPGNPPYLEYVRSSVKQKNDRYGLGLKNATDTDGFGDRYKNQYKERQGEEKLSTDVAGNPNLIYESKLVNSYEPTGVPDGIEITKCIGEQEVQSRTHQDGFPESDMRSHPRVQPP